MKQIVPSLALIAAASTGLTAVEMASPLSDRGADQYLQGSVLVEWNNQDNYTGDDSAHDQFWLRAELGTKIELEDHIELNIVFAYDAEWGDDTQNGNPGDNDGEVVLDEGNILFKRFLRPELDVRFGRQSVNWNLRSGFGAFLYDSRANNPDVTAWDGMVAHYDLDNVILRPYLYNLDENNESRGIEAPTGDDRRDNIIYGIIIDYEPAHESDNNIFFTANFSYEKNVYVDGSTTGDNLFTSYLGTEWNFTNNWDLYAEIAIQDGELDGTQDFDGDAFSIGVNTYFSVSSELPDNAMFGVQYDNFSGNDSSADFTGFVAPHEGVSDMMIVEHERYGELSEQLVGNLNAVKARFEWTLDKSERTVLSFLAASYEMNETTGGVDEEFGIEYDLSIDWEYSNYTNIKIFGAVFEPGDGYEDLFGNDDSISLWGMSIETLF